jgi:hypothetical protein
MGRILKQSYVIELSKPINLCLVENKSMVGVGWTRQNEQKQKI